MKLIWTICLLLGCGLLLVGCSCGAPAQSGNQPPAKPVKQDGNSDKPAEKPRPTTRPGGG